jgi:WD40 repeat protein
MTMHRFLTLSVLLAFFIVTVVPAQQTLTMHPKSVLKPVYGLVGFSHDGRTLATQGGVSGAQLWDVETGSLKKVLLQNVSTNDLSFSPDWRTVATWRWDKRTVSLWDTQTEQLKSTFEQGKFNTAAFSPDGRTVATADPDNRSAHLWDAETGQLKATLDHPKPYRYASGVDGMAFTPDGKTLVTASSGIVYLWEVATAKVRMKLIDPDVRIISEIYRSLKGFSHGDTIYDLAISPDGRTLATASRDATAKLWDLESGRLKAILKHESAVGTVVFSRDSKTLATGSRDRTARLWDVSSGKLIATLPHKGSVNSIDFSADGKLVATGADNDHSVKLWDARTGELLATLDQGRYPLAFSPDGRTLATGGSRSNEVLLWDITFR